MQANPALRRHFAAAFLPALLAGGAEPATAQVDDNDDVIVVQGQRPVTVRELRAQARSITPRAGASGEPLARMHAPICVGVWGMSVDSAHLVIDRIYYNAELVGLPVVREEGCTANIVVALTADADAEFAAMREEGHPLLRGVDLWQRKRIVRESDGPVVAWNVISRNDTNGQPIIGNPPVATSTLISRTMTSTSREIKVSVVFIDRDAVGDIDGVALADYVTMRALAHTRPPIEDTAVDTVLNLFDPEAGHTRLTAFDRAYLAGLYDSDTDRPMNMALGSIGTRLKQELTRED